MFLKLSYSFCFGLVASAAIFLPGSAKANSCSGLGPRPACEISINSGAQCQARCRIVDGVAQYVCPAACRGPSTGGGVGSNEDLDD